MVFSLSQRYVRNLLKEINFYPINWSEYKYHSTLQISDFVETLIEPKVSNDFFFRTKLGLHEAIINAVIHGNSGDPSKLVRVRRIFTPNWRIWQVQDEGNGFIHKSSENNLPDDIESIDGRGLFLINQCFDDVRWSPRGNRLQLANRK
tara:strand:+ start:4972 stop:5415 length:444 start_codon:yes stop_codon:yes gene_type:complete